MSESNKKVATILHRILILGLLLTTVSCSTKSIVLRGDKNLEKGKYHKAYELYEKALTNEPTDKDALRGLGRLELQDINYAEAKKYFRLAIYYGSSAAKKDRAELYYQLANNAHLNNQFNPALKYLDSSLMDYRLIKTKGIFK